MIFIFLQGLLLGFLIAAPVGPIGVLCIQRTLHKGRVSGFVSGLGAATADGLYGAIAAFGLVAISSFLVEQQLALRLIGGTFLLVIGITTFTSHPNEEHPDLKTTTLASDYLSTVFLTITNPMTILSFTALFAGIGFFAGSSVHAALLVAGVFLGSALWWLALSFGVGWIKSTMSVFPLRMVNRISGMIIIVFAFLLLANVLKSFL